MKFERSGVKILLITIAIILFSAVYASAVKVPKGTKLADEQVFTFVHSEVSSIDPHKMEAEPAFHICKELFDGLVSQDKVGNIIPAVAEKWESNETNTVYTFHLRKDAKWSNGDQVTAHDFVYAFRRFLTPETASPYSWFVQMANMKNAKQILAGEMKPESLGVKALDDQTFEVTLEGPLPFFVNMVSHPTLFPVHRKTIEKFGKTWTRPENIVSNGPFKLKEWRLNEKVVMVKNENYWNADEVILTKLVALSIPDVNIGYQRYRAGEADATKIPTEMVKKLKKETPDEINLLSPGLHSVHYACNVNVAPTNDVNVRKALAYALNRDIITKFVTGNGEIPLYHLSVPNIVGFNPVKTELEMMDQEQREAKAKEFLKKAGYSDKKQLKFKVTIPNYTKDKKYALAYIGMWKKVLGADVELEILEAKVFYAKKDNYQVIRAGWVADYNEPSTFLSLPSPTAGSMNSSKFDNAEYEMNLAQAKIAKDPSANYTRCDEILSEYYPVIPIYRPGFQARLLKPWVKGYELTNPESNFYRRDIYILKH